MQWSNLPISQSNIHILQLRNPITQLPDYPITRFMEAEVSEKEPTYNESQIAEKLKALPGWFYEDGWIRRVYKTDGWPTTLMLVNAIGYLAEAAYHHPDLSVTWG